MWHVYGTAEPPELGVRGSPRAGAGKILPRAAWRQDAEKQRSGKRVVRYGARYCWLGTLAVGDDCGRGGVGTRTLVSRFGDWRR
jgi:hypothetical protein